MKYVTSKDGTRIAFEKVGQGPAIIVVVGAFNDHTTGQPLAEALASHFTVFNYDRRGRGESGDTLPYAVDREIEDLETLIAEAGGSAYVFGYSSGAVLSLKAAAQGAAITKLALYEMPLVVESSSERNENTSQGRLSTASGQVIEVSSKQTHLHEDLAAELAALIAEGRRGEAVELFQTKAVGIPEEVVVQMRHAPFRPALEKIAHTLVYEMTILGDMSSPTAAAASVEVPTLLMAGSDSPAFMSNTAKALSAVLPHGEAQILEGQNHDIVASVMAPVVEAFFKKA